MTLPQFAVAVQTGQQYVPNQTLHPYKNTSNVGIHVSRIYVQYMLYGQVDMPLPLL